MVRIAVNMSGYSYKKPHYIRKHVYGIIREHESRVCSLFLNEDQAKRVVSNTLHHGHIVNIGFKGRVRTLTVKFFFNSLVGWDKHHGCKGGVGDMRKC